MFGFWSDIGQAPLLVLAVGTFRALVLVHDLGVDDVLVLGRGLAGGCALSTGLAALRIEVLTDLDLGGLQLLERGVDLVIVVGASSAFFRASTSAWTSVLISSGSFSALSLSSLSTE